MAGPLRYKLPATIGADARPPEEIANDLDVGLALQLGRLWLRFAERRTWPPLAHAYSLHQI